MYEIVIFIEEIVIIFFVGYVFSYAILTAREKIMNVVQTKKKEKRIFSLFGMIIFGISYLYSKYL